MNNTQGWTEKGGKRVVVIGGDMVRKMASDKQSAMQRGLGVVQVHGFLIPNANTRIEM